MNPMDFNGPEFLLVINTIFNFRDIPAIRTGLTYNVRSLQNNAGYRNTNLERNNYVHYETVSLGIPVLAHFQSKSIFYFDAGLTFAFVIDAKEGYYRNRNSSVGLRTRWDGSPYSDKQPF